MLAVALICQTRLQLIVDERLSMDRAAPWQWCPPSRGKPNGVARFGVDSFDIDVNHMHLKHIYKQCKGAFYNGECLRKTVKWDLTHCADKCLWRLLI